MRTFAPQKRRGVASIRKHQHKLFNNKSNLKLKRLCLKKQVNSQALSGTP